MKARPLRLVVLGTLAAQPWGGIAWMHMQMVVGLRRLGHDVTYIELSSTWPFDPFRNSPVADSHYALPFLEQVVKFFGVEDKWAYRRGYSDGAWFGPSSDDSLGLLKGADAVINVTGSTDPVKEGFEVGRLVFLDTDPGREADYATNRAGVRDLVQEHHDVLSYAENLGNGDCPLPLFPRFRGTTRQPVLVDLWAGEPLVRDEFTTVGNWRQNTRPVILDGEVYPWSKHPNFFRFLDLPKQTSQPLELALGAEELTSELQAQLSSSGWGTVDALSISSDPGAYRDYVTSSKGEFTVAKDSNVRLRTGWFSERSACYLAAGRPVVTQDTGFGVALPTGEGLFAFNTQEDAVEAFNKINSDYERHSRAAYEIAQEYFEAERVLAKLLDDLGL